VITHFRRRKNSGRTAAGIRQGDNMRETTLQTSRSVKKEGEEVLQGPEQRFPCSPWRRPW